MTKKASPLIFSLSFMLVSLSCAQVERQIPTVAKVYFREFEATSIVRLDENDFVKAADRQLSITDGDRVARIFSLVTAFPCQASKNNPENMDLRLLIYFGEGDNRHTWRASQFEYYDSQSRKVCILTPELKNQLSVEFNHD
jgi:hypothetical protein